MTSSKSKASRNKLLLALLLVVGALFVPSLAEASRKRVVVLELEGPKADKFHGDLVKLVKKTHTVIPVEKWNSTAEDLGATKLTDGNIKKVAKKLKIDAVIQGRIEKRRDEYIIQLKIRSGSSGAIVGNRIDTSADGPRLDAKASRDLKDELIASINTLKKGGSGDDEDADEEKPRKGSKAKSTDDDEEEAASDDEEEERPKSKKELAAAAAKKKKADAAAAKAEAAAAKAEKEEARLAAAEEKKKKKEKKAREEAEAEDEDEDEKPAKKGFGGKGDMDTVAALKTKSDDEADDEAPTKKKSADDEDEDEKPRKKKGKKVAASDEDDESVEAEADEPAPKAAALSPAERAIDAALGLSFNARRLKFTTTALISNKPPPYNGVPVAGIDLELTVYPLALGHTSTSPLRHLGITGLYDRVIKIESKTDDGQTLKSKQQRFAVGALYRYPVASIFTAGLSVRYGKQTFVIGGGANAPLPDVAYTMIEPSVFFKIGPFAKATLNLSVGFLGVMNTGQIQNNDQYGAATVTGIEGEAGLDYMLTKNVFARAAFRYEQFGYKFKGSGTMSTSRDMDPTTQDVFGASDKYIGATVLAGYVY